MPIAHTKKVLDASVPLNMRIKPAVRNLIARAAELLGKTRTNFMPEVSERRAEEALLVAHFVACEGNRVIAYCALASGAVKQPEAAGGFRRKCLTRFRVPSSAASQSTLLLGSRHP
ncbi:DUF1778 domain-containing protein [Sinorhizobium fredii]|uniref:type II toxin-antitoxin system TacA family antitoxin n=1 Tax=Rhizobium fredii TaxID=380 RepID=UPI00138AF1F5|nr:DUF1778 domain-containing protein [Sinorhizobium fredii]